MSKAVRNVLVVCIVGMALSAASSLWTRESTVAELGCGGPIIVMLCSHEPYASRQDKGFPLAYESRAIVPEGHSINEYFTNPKDLNGPVATQYLIVDAAIWTLLVWITFTTVTMLAKRKKA